MYINKLTVCLFIYLFVCLFYVIFLFLHNETRTGVHD